MKTLTAAPEILLVDDDPNVLDIVGESLGRRGYRVTKASNGRQALNTLENKPPELVVLDMILPDMTGRELMAQMRESGEFSPPILVLSADGDTSNRLAVLDEGAEDYLVKPVSLRELNAKIEAVLRRTSDARALRMQHDQLETEVNLGREHYTRVNRELKRQLYSMKTLFAVSQDLNRVQDPDELTSVVSFTLLGELQISSMAMFALVRENSREFELLGLKGFAQDKFYGIQIDRTGPFAQLLTDDSKPHKIARNPDRRWMQLLPDLRLAVFEYVTPIIVKGDTKGLIFTGPKLSQEEYSEYDLDMMTFIANSAGIGLENSRLLHQLQVTYVNTLKSFISIIEAKDSYTKGHTERVASYSMAIANRFELPHDHLRRIMFGALLHDIGKLGVMESVLHKEGKLDEEEWELLREHPTVGAGIVEKMEFLTGVAEIVKHHHESWDGRGYPDGLEGDKIPLGARIVTVADSFDAMTTDRSYRRALSVEQAIERLQAGAGTQFDPRVVRTFVSYIRNKGYELVVRDADGEED